MSWRYARIQIRDKIRYKDGTFDINEFQKADKSQMLWEFEALNKQNENTIKMYVKS